MLHCRSPRQGAQLRGVTGGSVVLVVVVDVDVLLVLALVLVFVAGWCGRAVDRAPDGSPVQPDSTSTPHSAANVPARPHLTGSAWHGPVRRPGRPD